MESCKHLANSPKKISDLVASGGAQLVAWITPFGPVPDRKKKKSRVSLPAHSQSTLPVAMHILPCLLLRLMSRFLSRLTPLILAGIIILPISTNGSLFRLPGTISGFGDQDLTATASDSAGISDPDTHTVQRGVGTLQFLPES